MFANKCTKQFLTIISVIVLLNVVSYVFLFKKHDPIDYSPTIIRGFLTHDEVDFINNKADGRYKKSVVGTKSYTFDDKVRVSDTAWLPLDDEQVLQNMVNRAIAQIRKDGLQSRAVKILPRQADWTYCEKLQIVRYKEGGFYKLYYDTVDKSNITKDTQVMYRKSGPRLSTMVISLSDPKEYGNGETVFPKLGNKKFKLNKGDALLFHSIDKNEKLIDQSFHGGEPLTYGEKRICNIWVHGTPTPK